MELLKIVPVTLIILFCNVFCEVLAIRNLSCYQCERNSNVECEPKELKPCEGVADRCVTTITKSDKEGFSIKRECGLGPCGFEDLMMNKGLGMDVCDRSVDEYFCVICCRQEGCNKSEGKRNYHASKGLILLLFIFIIMVYERVQPPYIEYDDY